MVGNMPPRLGTLLEPRYVETFLSLETLLRSKQVFVIFFKIIYLFLFWDSSFLMRFWVSSPLLSTVPQAWGHRRGCLPFWTHGHVPTHVLHVWVQKVGPGSGCGGGQMPGWAVLLCHLAQRPESILGAVSTPVKWGGGGGWGCYGPCDSRDIKAWPAKTFLADPPGYSSWAWKGCSVRRDVCWPGPGCPPGCPSSLTHCSQRVLPPVELLCPQFPGSMGGPGG